MYRRIYIYILDNKDINQAKRIWRFSKNEALYLSEAGINGVFKVFVDSIRAKEVSKDHIDVSK